MAWHQIAIRASIIAATPVLYLTLASTPPGTACATAITTTLARAATYALTLLNVPVALNNATIIVGDFHAIIAPECAALDITALLAAAILIYPAPLASRLRAVLLAALALAALNYIRILTLLLTGMYYPQYVDFAHEIVGQAALITAAIAIWLLWHRRISSPATTPKPIAA